MIRAFFYSLMVQFWPHLDIYQTITLPNGVKQQQLYLRVFYIWRAAWVARFIKTGSIYIHHFLNSDEDQDPHNHSWGFTSIILSGGYDDETWYWLNGKRVGPFHRTVERWSIQRRTADHTHRVRLKCGRPAWTLMIAGKNIRDFYFFTTEGPVVWWKALGYPEKPAQRGWRSLHS